MGLIVSIVLFMVNFLIIHYFASALISSSIGTEGKVLIGLVALAGTIAEIAKFYRQLFG